MADTKKIKIGEREFTAQKPTFKRMDQLKELGFDFTGGAMSNLKENIGKDFKKTAKALAIIFEPSESDIETTAEYIYEIGDIVDFAQGIGFFASAFTSRLNAIQAGLTPEAKEQVAKAKEKQNSSTSGK